MATVNLGRIKPIFTGAYSGADAYVVDDIVSHWNETFICIQAHGAGTQATTQTAYWTKLAAKGTDGTDVGTTITTQGDILYRDGSGLQRLAKPASDKFLQNTSGGVLSWESLSSDCVKVASSGAISGASTIDIDNQMSSDYKMYKFYLDRFSGNSTGQAIYWKMKYSTNTVVSSGYYFTNAYTSVTSGNSGDGRQTGWSNTESRIGWVGDGSATGLGMLELTIYNPSGTQRKVIHQTATGYDGVWYVHIDGGCNIHDTNAMTGLQIFPGGGTISCAGWYLYGFK